VAHFVAIGHSRPIEETFCPDLGIQWL